MSTNDSYVGYSSSASVTTPEFDKCLAERHWYAFLCSSLITLFTGLLLVLTWRIFAWTLCQRSPMDPDADQDGVRPDGTTSPGWTGSGGGSHAGQSDAQVGWVTSAQDWAGGMISGQTTTGRILVSGFRMNSCSF